MDAKLLIFLKEYKVKEKMKVILWAAVALTAILGVVRAHNCGHDEFVRDSEKHYLNDMSDHRLLQSSEVGR